MNREEVDAGGMDRTWPMWLWKLEQLKMIMGLVQKDGISQLSDIIH